MKFLVDAQLLRRFAGWLREAGHDALHTLEMPLSNRTPDHTLVTVNEAVRFAAVAMRKTHAALEHVGVVAGVLRGRIGFVYPKQLAQLGNEELIVGAFGAGRLAPFGNEGGGGYGGGGQSRRSARSRH